MLVLLLAPRRSAPDSGLWGSSVSDRHRRHIAKGVRLKAFLPVHSEKERVGQRQLSASVLLRAGAESESHFNRKAWD